MLISASRRDSSSMANFRWLNRPAMAAFYDQGLRYLIISETSGN